MKTRIINGVVLGTAVVLFGLSTHAMEKAPQYSATKDAASVVSQRNPAQVDLHGRGEKLPVLQKCGKRFGHIFSYCYSQQYFAANRTAPSRHSRTA